NVNIKETVAIDGGLYVNAANDQFLVNATGVATGKNLASVGGATISGADILLESTGGISLASAALGINSVSLVSVDSMTNIAGAAAQTVTLSASGINANIGTSSSNRVQIYAPNVTLNAHGNIFVADNSDGDVNGNVNLVNSTVDGTPYTNHANGTYSF